MPLSGGGAAPEHNKGTADTGGDREESLRRVFPAPPRSPSPLDFDLFLFIPSGQRSSGTPRGCGSPLMALLPCALRFVLGTALIYGSPGSARVRLRSPPLPPPTPHHNHHHHGERAAVASGGFNQEKEVPGESTAACRAVLAALFTQAGARALGLSRGQQGGGGGGSGGGRAKPPCAALGAGTVHPPARHRPVWRSESQNPESRVPELSLASPESGSRRKRLSAAQPGLKVPIL